MQTFANDARSMFLIARQYYVANCYLQTLSRRAFSPEVVTSAFALELMLKCILKIEDRKIPREHEFDSLFSRLSDEAKRILQKKWDDSYDIEGARALAAVTGQTSSLTLYDALKNSRHAFKQWRYLFETGGVARFDLSVLLKAANDYILERKPEWANDFPDPDLEAKNLRIYMQGLADGLSQAGATPSPGSTERGS
ncbi:hypothetical protein GB928_018845 [Shinella curvata]|uniref:HEPN domain-containing protein n=1 Tax=Shinella curvata TaxID=1817964 RepID=A0ABT8XHN1_9HYPH|nr:hypothetical protein [Shinella curvata]MCJ8053919.1 hypothetical protein [Shinella curvata]MDO6123251.1 hypothetical protein [Shinella curvata]